MRSSILPTSGTAGPTIFFNGVNPFGPADLNARIWANIGGVLEQFLRSGLNNSSLASQAVGPPGSEFEMSARGRPFPKIGKKMLSLVPLAKQKVSSTDSVLGTVAAPDKGLTVSYSQLIQQAFNPKYWNSADIVVFNSGCADSPAQSRSPPDNG